MPSRREFELFLTLRGALGSDFSNSMRRAQTEFKALRTAMSSVNDRMRDVSAYQRLSQAIRENEQRLRELQARHSEIQEAMQQISAPSAGLRRQLSQNEAQIQALNSSIGDLQARHVEIQNAMRQTGAPIAELRRQLSQNEAQIRSLNDCMGGLQARHDEIQDEMRQNRAESTRLQRQMSQNEAQIQSLCDRMGEQQRELGQMGGALRDARIDTGNLADETAELQRQYEDLSNCRRHLESLNEAIDNNKTKLKDAVKEFRDMTAAFVGAGTAAYAATVKPAIAYESAFTGVLKTVNGTQEQFADLRQEMINMSQTDVIASAKDIAAVAEAAGQLGIHTENIDSFSKTMIYLGDSTNLASTEAAESLAKFANITKMPQTEFSRLGSVIVDLGNNMATTEADIVAMGTRLASTGELVGLSEADIMGYAAALSSLGIEAEAGGTAASKMLKSMELAFSRGDMSNYANAAGMTAKEFSELYQNNKLGAISAFTKGLNDVERNGKTAIQILDEMGINEVRLSNAVLALAASNDILTDATSIANKAWEENTALSNEAQKRYQTTESRIQLTKNAVENLGISLGDLATPFVQDMADDFTEAAMRAQRFVRENGESIKEFAKGAVEVGKFALTLKGLQVAYLGVKGGVLVVGKAIATFTTICATARTMTGGMNFRNLIKSFSMVTGVSITAAGAIAGVTVALAAAGIAIYKNGKDVKASLKSVMDSGMLNNGGKKLSEFADEYKSATSEAKRFAEQIVGTNSAHEENGMAIKKAADEIYLFNEQMKTAGGMTAETAEALKKPFADLSTTLKENFSVSYSNVFSAFSANAKHAAEDLGVEVSQISGILDSFNKKYNGAIDDTQTEINTYLDKVTAGGGVSQEEIDNYLKNVEFMQKMSEAREGKISSADVAQRASEIGKLDLGTNREVAIQEINDFAAYIKDYTGQLTDAQKTLQKEFATSYTEAKTLYEYGKYSAEEYELVKAALAQAEAVTQLSYEQKIADAQNLAAQTAERISSRIDLTANQATSDQINSGKLDFIAGLSSIFTGKDSGETYFFALKAKALETYADVSKANAELRRSAEDPIEVSVNARAALEELRKVKEAREEATGSSGGVIVATADFDGYASGTNYAESGLRLVGENGPELLQFRGGERVYNARETADILDGLPSAPINSHYSGNSYNITVNPTFYGGTEGSADEYGAQIAEEIIRRLDERERDARRNAYY